MLPQLPQAQRENEEGFETQRKQHGQNRKVQPDDDGRQNDQARGAQYGTGKDRSGTQLGGEDTGAQTSSAFEIAEYKTSREARNLPVT
jgi:hypothetical protein